MTTKPKKNADKIETPEEQSCQLKVCQVCSDKALGYNFNAVTCESCKAFFRRNALSNKEFTCPFSANCEITVVTRRFCQKCRLEKCFSIGMKKEYIMSEVEKQQKRDKVQQNRAKKRQRAYLTDEHMNDVVNSPDTTTTNVEAVVLPQKFMKLNDHSIVDGERETHSTGSFQAQATPVLFTSVIMSAATPSSSGQFAPNRHSADPTLVSPSAPVDSSSDTVSSNLPLEQQPMPTIESSPAEIVQRIIGVPHQSSKVINNLMSTPENALYVMSNIVSSQTEALQLINHFIQHPGDALQVISKIMNSPLDALTVFAQFMSSPIDSLQIISKVMSSPNDVLDFMRHLMMKPEDALEIITKFMSAPAEALQIINRMMNNRVVPDSYDESKHRKVLIEKEDDSMIKSILDASVGNKARDLPQPTVTDHSDSNAAWNGSATAHQCSGSTSFNHPTHDPPFDTTRDVIEDIEKKTIEPGSFESLIYQAIKIEYEGISSNTAFSQQPSSSSSSSSAPAGSNASKTYSQAGNSRELNDGERAKLNELIVANKALYAPVDEDLSSLISDDCGINPESNEANTPLLRVINLTAIAIRRLIKMSKKINSFKNMCQEDQIALLKGGCIEMMILRSVMQYDFDRATWKIPHSQEEMSNIKVDVLKLAKGNIYEEHERFIVTFEKDWRNDENIILILCAIVLFTPDRPKTVHSDVIKLEQNSYYYLLRRYLESVYTGCEAKSTFLKLIKKINELHKLNKEMISVYLNVNPSQVEPLLREIFDLKVHSV